MDVQWPEWYEETGVVRIEVFEGRRGLMGPLVFTGNSMMGARDLQDAADITSGVTLTPEVIDDLRSSLLELYSRHGYVLASVEISLLPFDPSSPDSLPAPRGVECDISEGRQIRLGNVDVQGLETVRKTGGYQGDTPLPGRLPRHGDDEAVYIRHLRTRPLQ